MSSTALALVPSYDHRLVALSVLVAICASYTGLDLAGRTSTAQGRARIVWLSGGAAAMGLGIWSTHYITMLAFILPVPVLYDLPTVFLSFVAAVFASAVALWVVSRRTLTLVSAMAGGVILGAGIAIMHYIGMAAMRMPAQCQWNTSMVALSVVIAIVVSLIALWLAFQFRSQTKGVRFLKLASAAVLGFAITGTHYTGTAAASYMPSSTMHDTSHAVGVSSLGVVAVTTVTFMVLILAALTPVASRHNSAPRRLVRPLIGLFFAVVGGVAAFETAKMVVFPDITLWASHLMTITFSGVAAVVAGYFLLQEQSRLLEKALAALRTSERAEEALRENEARLRSSSDNLPGGMVYQIELGDGGTRRFTYVSSGVEKLHEVTAEAALRDAQLLYGQTLEADRPLVAAREAGMVASMTPFFAEVRCRLPSGVMRWSLLASAPRRTPDGRVICDSIELDITERKRAEEALRTSETQFRTLIDLAPLAINISRSGKTLHVNRKLLQMYGYESVDEVIGQSVGEHWSKEWRPIIEERVRQRALGLPVPARYEGVGQRKDGSQFPVEIVVASVVLPDGDANIAFLIDISERKQAEDVLRKLNAELEQRVTERTHQLNVINQELEVRNTELSASNQELETFCYSVAHDLRAPLRQIQGFSYLLREGHGTDLAPEAHEYIRNIVEGAKHMGQLIDDLLELSRLGRQALSLEVMSLHALVEDARRDLTRDIGGRDVRWQIGDLPLMECDPVLMRQVFVNLLSNALKYTQRRQPAVIEIGQVNREGMPTIFVKDNGVGFNMKYAAKLFGVFQRLHRRDEFEGTGIGLATEAHR